MIPETIGAVVAFLLLITPGFVWDQCVARHIPQHKETILREVSRIVVASILATIPAALALYWVLWVPALNAPESLVRLLTASAITSFLAVLLTYSVAKIKFRGHGSVRSDSVLFLALIEMPRSQGVAHPIICVTLDGGVLWVGSYAGVDMGPEETNPLLLLKPPLKRKNPDDLSFVRYSTKNYALLPMNKVLSMRLEFVGDDPKHD